jgi:adenylate cyclase
VEVRTVLVRGQEPGGRSPEARLRPTRRLLLDAIVHRRQSVFYRWDVQERQPEYTAHLGSDWALCAPLPDEPEPGWGLYVTGRQYETAAVPGGPPRDQVLKGDLKFTELVADIFGSLRQVRDLQRRHAELAHILSPAVLAALATRDGDVLRPRQTKVTVLFCDLRGSSRTIEEGQSDLAGMWERLSEALSIMTSSIIDQEGVVGDFQGDAAMGFWGWPLEQSDQVERAARAALTIRRRFARAALERGNPLAGFACGIGIAHGPAIAGRLGTPDQFKVGVFGHVVNLAARLEALTKQFGVPILIDEQASARLTGAHTRYLCRTRRVARLRPAGMRTALTVSELLPPLGEPGAMPEGNRRDYEAALDAFLAGRFRDAADLLRPLRHDGPARFLLDYMDRQQGTLTPAWDGVITMESK